jgi:formate dehydrogenase subunit gamma
MQATPAGKPATMPLDLPDLQPTLARILADHKAMEGSLLPILHSVQAEWGHIPQDALPVIARALNISRAEVHGVVTFYHDFREVPAGRHVLKLCRAEACQARGAGQTAAAAQSRLGLDWHETAADGRVTLEPVFCLGLCAQGPAALLDGVAIAQVTPERVGTLLDEVLS